ncbi:MAG: hypothetical protein WD356_07245 [Pseudomonadales bacterium]
MNVSKFEISNALDIVDLDRYPIQHSEDPRLQRVIKRAHADLDSDGCAVIPGFVRPDLHQTLCEETTTLAPKATFSEEPYTPYGTLADNSFPHGHPRRAAYRTTIGNVGKDQIPEQTLIKRLYYSDLFKEFLAACLKADKIYEFADPIRGLTINTMQDGARLGWHFDANEFVVSLLARGANDGGLFEYCPGIRESGNENYAAVQSVLEGARERVKVLDLKVGDLQLFKGRFSLHRVTQVVGNRHTVIFGYAREPGFIGKVESTLRVYGRVCQEHIEAEAQCHGDGLTD